MPEKTGAGLRVLASTFMEDARAVAMSAFRDKSGVAQISKNVCLWPRVCENSKSRGAMRIYFLSSNTKLKWLAMLAPKAVLNEYLVLSRFSLFAFPHSLGQLPTQAVQQAA